MNYSVLLLPVLLVSLNEFLYTPKKVDVSLPKIDEKVQIKENRIDEEKKKREVTPKKSIISISQKKDNFKSLLVPPIVRIHNSLYNRYTKISQELNSSTFDMEEIKKLKKYYKVETDKDLLEALKPAPVSVVLAQAAIESAWGTSRFLKEANNIFGIWSFNKNEPRISAGGTRENNKTIWLKKYSSLDESVKNYYFVLSTSPYLKKFRELNLQTDDPHKLIKGLLYYSEQREKYVTMISSVIKHNNFDDYDVNYSIEVNDLNNSELSLK